MHADPPYCLDVRPSSTPLVWALLLAGWLGCSLCLAASWDHVLRVPGEGRERCRFKEEQCLGRDLDFFPPSSVFLLPRTALGKSHLRCWDTQDAPSPRLHQRGAVWLLWCGCRAARAHPTGRPCNRLTGGARDAHLKDHPASPASPRWRGAWVDSALVFAALGLQVNCQGEGGAARPGLGGVRAASEVHSPISSPFGGAGGGNAAAQAAVPWPRPAGRLPAVAGRKPCFPSQLRQLPGRC